MACVGAFRQSSQLLCFVGIDCGSSWLLMIVVSPMGNLR
jgi:hypothetical protein